jgi:ferredoxin-type protein NapG
VPVLRPPGAVDEPDFLRLCTRCDACVEACPHDAVTRAPARLRAAAGTPVIDPLAAPCRMCTDVPCAAACQPGALRVDQGRVMGRAVIGAQDCLAYQGTTCSTCVEQCPVPGALRLVAGRPVVDASVCTGCGVCQHVCPSPRNAVIVLPALRRGGAA